jgi:hypothetical protein
MKNKIEDLRNHLFATLEALQDPDNPMDLERAAAVVSVSQTLINSAKVEVDFVRATGRVTGSEFIDTENRCALPGPAQARLAGERG